MTEIEDETEIEDDFKSENEDDSEPETEDDFISETEDDREFGTEDDSEDTDDDDLNSEDTDEDIYDMCPRPPSIYNPKRIGLPQVDKLLAEEKSIDIVRNSASTAIKFLDGDKDMEDSISRMPNDVLQYIISLLTMREAAATSILSPRWRYLWSTSASRLCFDDLNVLGYKYPYDKGGREHSAFQESLRTKFITRVYQICQLRRASKLDTLEVSFPLHDDSASHIDRLIELAAAQGVTKLISDFSWHINHSCRGGETYEFPFQRFGSSLKYLELCTIQFPPNFLGLKSLASLKLSKCYLTDKDVENILSNCHSLQWLSLRSIDFPHLTTLKFVGPSIQLKHLHIGCYDIKKVKVQDVNLLSFELETEEVKTKLSIKNVPHLARLQLCTLGPVKILGNLPCLETLFFQREEGELPKLSMFSNLKRLVFTDDNLRTNLVEVVSFLEACPLLQQLELDMQFAGREVDGQDEAELERLNSKFEGLNSEISSRPKCSHHNLTEVDIHGFDSHPEIIELAKYLLENATALERMRISRKTKTYCGNGAYYCPVGLTRLVGMLPEKVLELLREKAHPSTQVLIV